MEEVWGLHPRSLSRQPLRMPSGYGRLRTQSVYQGQLTAVYSNDIEGARIEWFLDVVLEV